MAPPYILIFQWEIMVFVMGKNHRFWYCNFGQNSSPNRLKFFWLLVDFFNISLIKPTFNIKAVIMMLPNNGQNIKSWFSQRNTDKSTKNWKHSTQNVAIQLKCSICSIRLMFCPKCFFFLIFDLAHITIFQWKL